MTSTSHRPAAPVSTGWYSPADCRIEDLRAVVEQTTDLAEHPHADEVAQNVPVYGELLRDVPDDPERRRTLQSELAATLLDGPGIVVVRGAFEESIVDRATAAFRDLIEEQKRGNGPSGDHFAKPGANDRLWGALDKLAVADPDTFAAYYANDLLALVCEAWLGPGYQVTSQVNVVNPGGQAQVAHRDYHLGFMDRERALAFPAQVHALSPTLTLQGAVAHVDMPLESGPTLYLPHSQKYPPGYVAYHEPAFSAYFEEHHVQLPLSKGDAVFFNPALFHGAGTNHTTDVRRMANLLQVSSAFGRAMEAVDTAAICRAVHPVLTRWRAEGRSDREIAHVVTTAAECYPFPTNLDLDQPVDSLVPPSQADLLRQAVLEGWSPDELDRALGAQASRRTSRVG